MKSVGNRTLTEVRQKCSKSILSIEKILQCGSERNSADAKAATLTAGGADH